jgi:hypothetical protein
MEMLKTLEDQKNQVKELINNEMGLKKKNDSLKANI